jgi:ribonuclease HI
VDGGCRNNGKENPQAYGSFKVFVNTKEVHHEQFDLPGYSTSNQAEWAAMIEALEYIGEEPKRRTLQWVIETDSDLVRNQIVGKWKCKDAILKVKQMFAMDYIKANNLDVIVGRIPGDEVKEILGH